MDDSADLYPTWPRLRGLLQQLTAVEPDFAATLATAIHATVAEYATEGAISYAELLASCAAHIAFMQEHGTRDVADGPRQIGADRARSGVALNAVLSAYRVGSRTIWERIAAIAGADGATSTKDLVALASDVWLMHDEFASALESGWQEAERIRVLQSSHERASIVDSIVRSSTDSPSRLWEAVDRLGLPRDSGYLVVVVLVDRLGDDPLPGIERRLEARRIPSAWLLRSEMLVGVVTTAAVNAETVLLDQLQRVDATAGISPPQHDFADGSRAFRFAAAAAAASPAGRTTRFHEAPTAVVVASTPDVAHEAAIVLFRRLLDLPPDEQTVLLSTLSTWFDTSGSTAATASALYLHPNTVRNRLHRIESLTELDLTSPRDSAAIAVALTALEQWRGRRS